MKTKLSKIIIAALALFGLSTSLFLAPSTYATDDICELQTVSQAVKDAYGCPGSNQGNKDDFSNALQGILNGIIAALGLVAVVVIIIGGVGYMTASGDAGKLQKAKTTIISAIIGLIICVLSFAIVNFVIINIIAGERTPASTSQGK